jgi:hypothetical protein
MSVVTTGSGRRLGTATVGSSRSAALAAGRGCSELSDRTEIDDLLPVYGALIIVSLSKSMPDTLDRQKSPQRLVALMQRMVVPGFIVAAPSLTPMESME